MDEIKTVSTLELVECLSIAMDLVSPVIASHQRRVGYISYQIVKETGLQGEELNSLLIAGLLHDCGALPMKNREITLRFDYEEGKESFSHSEAGYQLLKQFEPFAEVAHYVRYHHKPWGDGAGRSAGDREVSINSHIINIADRVDTLIRKDRNILMQADEVMDLVENKQGELFVPYLVDALKSVGGKESFWLDIDTINKGMDVSGLTRFARLRLDIPNLLNMVSLFSHIIDFRSRFTATHSSGVAASAGVLGRLAGFSEHECFFLKVAGYLHDLGKLVVPKDVLEKPGKLSKEEFAVIKSHSYYTYKILKNFRDLDTVSQWASYHHERIDGGGYPFHLTGEQLPVGAKITGVADVFTALTEDRPYRKGMSGDQAVRILLDMAGVRALDSAIVHLLQDNLEEVNAIRLEEQAEAEKDYQKFASALNKG